MPELSFLKEKSEPTEAKEVILTNPPQYPKDDPYALEPVKASLAVYSGQFQALLDEAAAVTIVDPGSNSEAVAVTGKLSSLIKKMDEARKKIGEPARDFTSAVNNIFNEPINKLKSALVALKEQIKQYSKQQELERRKREEAQRRLAAELQKKMDAEAAKEGIKVPKLQPIPEPAPPKTVRTESGKATIVEHWTFEVTNPDEVPREFLMVDEKKIRRAVDQGRREIDGVRIYEDSQVRIRS